jgi:hypothetical protein
VTARLTIKSYDVLDVLSPYLFGGYVFKLSIVRDISYYCDFLSDGIDEMKNGVRKKYRQRYPRESSTLYQHEYCLRFPELQHLRNTKRMKNMVNVKIVLYPDT